MIIKEISYEEKLQIMKENGVDPLKLKNYNPVFFDAIVKRIREKIGFTSPLNENNQFWELGNPDLWEKCKPIPKPRRD